MERKTMVWRSDREERERESVEILWLIMNK